MSRPVIIVLCALVAAPAAVASTRVTGDGVLELRKVNAERATVVGRGAIWGQLDAGQLKVTDPYPDDDVSAQVSGAVTRTTPEPGVTVYRGKNIHFRFAGGRYRFSLAGSGINLTAVGVGAAYVVGDPLWAAAGDFSVDSARWQPVPFFLKKIAFGAQTPASTGP